MEHREASNIVSIAYSASDRVRDRVLLVTGAIGATSWIIFLAACDFLPPIAPSASVQEVAEHYATHQPALKGTLFLVCLSSITWPIYSLAVHHQLERLTGVSSGILILQLAAGMGNGIILALLTTFFATAAYRVDRNPELIQLVNDLGWLAGYFCSSPLMVQFLCVSWAVISARGPRVLFPRWLGCLLLIFPLWCIMVFAVHCVHTGPMAWDGALVFWAAWGTFLVSFVPLEYYLWKMTGKINVK